MSCICDVCVRVRSSSESSSLAHSVWHFQFSDLFRSISLNSLLMASLNACPIRDSSWASTTYLAPRHPLRSQIWDFVLLRYINISARSARFRPQDSRVNLSYFFTFTGEIFDVLPSTLGSANDVSFVLRNVAKHFEKRYSVLFCLSGRVAFSRPSSSSPGIVAMAKTKKMATDDADDGYSYGE